MPVPVVIYAAKSTQDKRESIPEQLGDGRAKAAEEDWEVVGEFSDEGFSAYSGNRGPGLEQAKRAAAEAAERFGVPCMLVAQASDRFARGAGDKPDSAEALVEIWHALRRLSVHLRSVEDDGDLRDSASVANLGHRSMMESRRKSGSVKKGMRRRREKGLSNGRPPMGYRHEKGVGLIVVEAQAAIVRRIFNEYIAGKSQLAIARGLLRDGVPTTRGGPWRQTTVRALLANPIFVGLVRHGEETLPGTHETIIDRETWEKATALRTSKARTNGPGRPSSGKHLFRKGMLRCGECGEAMVPKTQRNRQQAPYEAYICNGRTHDINRCSTTIQQRADIDMAVFNYFSQVGLDIEATRDQLAESRDYKLGEVRALMAQAETEKHKAEERLARIRRDYADDKISAEDWSEFREELTGELQAAQANAERLRDQAAEVEAWGELHDVERDTLAKLADLRAVVAGEINDAEGIAAVRSALTRLFDHFHVRRIQPGVRIHADLAWQGDFYLDPEPSERVIEGYSPLRPIFRREPIYDDGTIIGAGSHSTSRSCGRGSAPCCAAARAAARARSGSAS
jgi:site-specific DNA recombinase